jgi:phage recombination protein Bet
MAGEIAELRQQSALQWTDSQIETLKKTVAKDATPDELNMFLHLSQTYGLDPFAKEIWFLKMGGAPTIMTSRDGYLKIANNDPSFEGLVSDAVYEGDEFRKLPEGVEHRYGANKRGAVVGAYALVYRRGIRFPIYAFAPFKDYNKGSGTWRQYPHAMILKVAESMALKRAFSLSGLVSREEIEAEGAAEIPKEPAPAAAPPSPVVSEAKRLWDEYKEVCGNPHHAKNAFQMVTGGKAGGELTAGDIDALRADLALRREAMRATESGGEALDGSEADAPEGRVA